MEADNPNDFNQRLNQWIASQGFWFHLRHSMSSGGGVTSAVFHLLRMLVRVGVLAAVAALGFGFYLFKRVDTESFQERVRAGLAEAFHAKEAKISSFHRIQNEGAIRRLGLSGTEDSFFQSLEVGTLVFEMGLFDGVLGRGWDVGVLRANWLDAELRAGVNGAEAAKKAAAVLFVENPRFVVQGLEVVDTRLSWGYFQRAYGGISGSRMVATRAGDGWRLRFRGGYFTQNWIRRFEIEELVVTSRPDGVTVDSGLLRSEDGTVTFHDVKVEGSWEMPELSGKLVFDHVPLRSVLPSNVAKFIDGTFSGEFQIGGSTNSSEGVTFKGSANLDGSNVVTLRDDLHLLEALDVVDVFNSYKRVDFDQGSFDLSTGGGEMLVSGLELQARELMSIYGRFTVRPPTEQELGGLFGAEVDARGAAVGQTAVSEDPLRMTLKRAGKAARAEDDGDGEVVDPETQAFFGDISEQRRLRRDILDRARDVFILGGGVQLQIPSDAFDRSRKLRERFPVDPATGRVAIDVPLEGTLDGLTLDLAEQILDDGTVE